MHSFPKPNLSLGIDFTFIWNSEQRRRRASLPLHRQSSANYFNIAIDKHGLQTDVKDRCPSLLKTCAGSLNTCNKCTDIPCKEVLYWLFGPAVGFSLIVVFPCGWSIIVTAFKVQIVVHSLPQGERSQMCGEESGWLQAVGQITWKTKLLLAVINSSANCLLGFTSSGESLVTIWPAALHRKGLYRSCRTKSPAA